MAKKETLNRSKFLNAVADRTGAHRRDVEHVWEHALAVIQDSVKKGQDVSISGFGKFKARVVKARKAGWGTNPFTGEKVKQAARPASKTPKFLPAKNFKEVVAGRVKPAAPNTKPVALAGDAAPAKKTAKKAAAKKKPAKKKAAAKKKPAAKKKATRRR